MTWGVNDYPARGRCPGACSQNCSPACGSGGATCCQCVSFAWWRVCNDLHVTLGHGYGNASTWAAASRANGIPVDHSPRVDDIVCLPSISAAGHVAAVLAVGPTTAYGHTVPPGSVLVEDYNWGFCCCYQQHLLPISTGGNSETLFIHFAHAPQPPPPPPTCPACGVCSVCSDPAVGCVPLDCGPCQLCTGGGCVDACAPGQSCVGGVCATPVPQPSTVPPSLAVGLLLVAAIGVAAVWDARRHPAASGAVVARLQGGQPAALGHEHPGLEATIHRAEAVVAHEFRDHPPGLGHG